MKIDICTAFKFHISFVRMKIAKQQNKKKFIVLTFILLLYQRIYHRKSMRVLRKK